MNRISIRAFKAMKDWDAWLAENHATSVGIWLRIYRKESNHRTVTYAEALDGALCYGWIDGQKRAYDGQSFLQKFTPRRSRSMWSKRNIEHTKRLIEEGRMKPAGLKEIETAKADGRWSRAYDSPKTIPLPADFLEELAKNKKAETFFKSLNKANVYSIAWRLQTAKRPETRERRMKAILDMMKKGEKFH